MYASVPCSGFFPVFLWRPALHPPKQKSPGAQQIQHCQTPEPKEQISHNPAEDSLDSVKSQSLPIHCIRLTSRNISFIRSSRRRLLPPTSHTTGHAVPHPAVQLTWHLALQRYSSAESKPNFFKRAFDIA